jgi:protein SCO1/2
MTFSAIRPPRPVPALRRCLGVLGLTAAGLMALAQPALSATAADPHAGHAMQIGGSGVMQQQYSLPDVPVTRQDGKRMRLAQALDDGRPVMLNFIYTSCNAICPVTSQVFTEVRERLGAERDKINMVSISIDPEQDTPKRLTAYAKRFGASGTWSHYTSSTADSIEIQRAFGAWRGDKMNHQPITWLRPAPGKPWLRFEGFTSPEDLVKAYVQATQGEAGDYCPPAEAARPADGAKVAALGGTAHGSSGAAAMTVATMPSTTATPTARVATGVHRSTPATMPAAPRSPNRTTP